MKVNKGHAEKKAEVIGEVNKNNSFILLFLLHFMLAVAGGLYYLLLVRGK